ncbi:hypothetical protein [Sodalis glossinidius]|uniref:hypothetical protein n=1 Tax=Sodalis glossinidius TaxID=63612 RepID=UPI0003189FCA|nr:hypothetical protein [Sodalis glossinidius]
MHSHLHGEIIQRLIKEFQFVEQGEYLRKGICPYCKKRELFTSIEKPYVLRCGRENKCGSEVIVKAHYDDLFSHWSERYLPTTKQPHAAAEAYLREGRGLDMALIAGCYTQESYHQKGLGTGRCVFPCPAAHTGSA